MMKRLLRLPISPDILSLHELFLFFFAFFANTFDYKLFT
jgi:hypothetical protein